MIFALAVFAVAGSASAGGGDVTTCTASARADGCTPEEPADVGLLQVMDKAVRAHSFGEVCQVGDNVKCPGSDAYCMGESCCQGSGATFPCPSAPDGWGTGFCTTNIKQSNCLENGGTPGPMPSPPTPAPSPPAPTPSPPGPAPSPPEPAPSPQSSGITRINIFNNEWSDGVVFCRGPPGAPLDGVFLDEELTESVVGSDMDCSSPDSLAAKEWGAGVPDETTTLAIGLATGASISLYIAPEGTWGSGTCWYQDEASNKKQSLAKGPMYQSQTEFTITSTTGTNPVVSYDLTSVEGVSGGLTMNYTKDDGKKVDVVAVPGPFKGDKLKVVPAPVVGFPTILSDKWTAGDCSCTTEPGEPFDPDSAACNTDGCYAACPGTLADWPCGQHRCRIYYFQLYETDESYCGWLYAENAMTYCWAMDEWVCTDATCGYGGDNQPPQDCSAPYPDGVFGNPSYSCGKDLNLPSGTPDEVWWPDAVGCVDKLVEDVPTNPQIPRMGGVIDMSFEKLDWLHQSVQK